MKPGVGNREEFEKFTCMAMNSMKQHMADS